MDIIFDRLTHQTGDIGLIKLDRAKRLNALTHEMILSLFNNLIEWKNDPTIKAVVIKSLDEKVFCAGGDVRAIYEKGRTDPKSAMKFFFDEYRLNYLIHHYPKPYIALVNGVTMGGGVGIALHGSHRIAVGAVSIAMPETALGLFPDVGGGYLLTNSPQSYGAYWALTGNRMNAADALNMEWIDKAILSKDEINFIEQLQALDLGCDAKSVVSHLARSMQCDMGKTSILDHQSVIEDCFKHNSVESILEALKSFNTPESEILLSTLSKKSPISMKVTLAQLQRAKGKSFSECIKTEYRMVSHFLTGHDFYEGVRALLIDKDKMPQWQYNHLNEVTTDTVENYFEPLDQELVVEDIF